jgi:type IV pilus assembly protein PilE
MMIVVALIAILAGIALPAYNGYVNRSKIKTAQADLVALSLNYENHYQRRLAYPLNAEDLSTTDKLSTYFKKSWLPASKDFDFKTDTTVASGSNYKIIATGKSGTGVSGCAVSIDKGGDKKIGTCSYSADGKWL